ncbi:MAG: hypothetical protein QM754_11165 [Tepidisphaeraceae bacterium]
MPSVFWRIGCIACVAALVLVGIDWGLPAAETAAPLFGDRPAWDGQALAQFDADRVNAGVGADVDRDPVQKTAEPVPLNPDDAARAGIVRRFKLFSHQPDEMITFMALQQMNPAAREFDPRLYQYGGAWIYPVGGLLKAAGQIGWIDLKADKAFYYDNPAAFGKFYVVARLYTLAGYVLLITTVGMILWRLTKDDAVSGVGAAVVGLLPVVFAMGHEAKPHIAGCAWVLMTALAAARWVRSGAWRDALLTGLFTGLAGGTVLSAGIVAVIPMTMVLLRRETFSLRPDGVGRRIGTLVVVGVVAMVVFAVTNPYVILHAVHRDPVLTSNLGNTQAMYRVGDIEDLFRDGALRLLDALSWPMAALAGVAFFMAITRQQRVSPLGILLTVPTLLVLIQFFAFAAGKPGEYARFALLPTATLGMLGVWALSTIRVAWLRRLGLIATPVAVLAAGTWPYIAAFAADVGPRNTRVKVAEAIEALPAGTLDLWAEPAPYATPAIDLWKWNLRLLPPNAAPTGDVALRAIDDPAALPRVPVGYRRQIVTADTPPAPITWANKPFELLIKEKTETTVPSP